MIDDRTISDTARSPRSETPGFARIGVRPAAKKATKKTAKKAAKKTAKKKTTGKKAVKAGGAVKSGGVSGDGAKKKTAKKKAARAAPAPSAVPDTSVPGAAAGGSPTGSPPGDPAVGERASRADAPRPIVPAHAGAHMMDAAPEELGGLGGFLALWGPLIIVGFLVLVFRGGDERETAAASDPGASVPPQAMASATAEAPRAAGAAPGSAGATFARGFGDAGASPMPAASQVAAAWTDSDGGYPSPPGPYRSPGARGLPAGEGWAAHAGEWATPAGSRRGSGYGAGGGSPSRWVRCAAPYYWCPAPSSPAW